MKGLLVCIVTAIGCCSWLLGFGFAEQVYAAGPSIQSRLSDLAWKQVDDFFNVLQIMDAQTGRPLAVERIDGASEGTVGVRLADRVVLFQRDGVPADREIGFTISGEGQPKVLATDLAAGEWEVLKDGTCLIEARSTADQQAICFAGPAGKYVLRMKR